MLVQCVIISVCGSHGWHFGVVGQWVVGYVLVAGLAGMAVTYYYDDPANVKLNTILRHGLRVLGLALVATSTTWSRASLGLAAALFAAQLTHTMALPRCGISRDRRRRVLLTRTSWVQLRSVLCGPPAGSRN